MNNLGDTVLSLYKTLEARHKEAYVAAGLENKITCKKGCSLCCYEHVDVYAVEIAPIVEAIMEMSLEQQNRLAKRMKEYVEIRKGTDALEIMTSLEDAKAAGLTEAHPSQKELDQINEKYSERAIRHRRLAWEKGSPCPFLESGECSVYEARPYACRSMSSVEEPVYEKYRAGNAPIVRFDGVDMAQALAWWAQQSNGKVTDLTLPHGPLIGVLHHLVGDEIFNIEEEDANV
jgi:Fe-S-cluster containining protein